MSRSKRKKAVKTARVTLGGKKRETTATGTPLLFRSWRDLVKKTKKEAQKKYTHCTYLQNQNIILKIYITLNVISVRFFFMQPV
jgi:hypothetical protein